MKKLLMAVASAVAIGFSAYAANTSWFNGGVAEGFPTAGDGLSGGAWSNTTDQAEWQSELNAVAIESDAANPVEFVATQAKAVGTDAKSLTFKASLEFTPHADISQVTSDALAGVCVVSNATEANVVYVLEKDSGSGSNKWISTEMTVANLDEEVDVEMIVTKGDEANVGWATYIVGHQTNEEVNVAINDAAGFSKMVFVGDCELKSLEGFSDSECILTLPEVEAGVTTVVTNVSDGTVYEITGNTVNVPLGATVAVSFTAPEGRLFVDEEGYGVSVITTDPIEVTGDLTVETDPGDTEVAQAKNVDTEKLYLTLQDAIDEAGGEGTVQLCVSVELDATLTVQDKSIVLDLNDCSITNSDSDVYAIEATSELIIQNGTIAAEGDAIFANDLVLENVQVTSASGAAVTMRGEGFKNLYIDNEFVTLTGDTALALDATEASEPAVTISDGTYTGALAIDGLTKFISGGSFSVDPSDYVAENCMVEQDLETGMYVVTQSADPAAKYDDTEYDTLEAALEAAGEAGEAATVTLLRNNDEQNLEIPSNVTLDLDEYTIITNGLVNNGTIKVYDLETAKLYKDLAGTLEAGDEIGSQQEGMIFPLGTTIACTKEVVESAEHTNTIVRQAINVPSETTLFWGDVINPYQQVTVTGNAIFGGAAISAGLNETLVSKLTVNGDLQFTSDFSIGAFAEVSVSGTLTRDAGTSGKITLKATTSKLTNDGSLVANTDVVTDVENYAVAKNDGVYTIAAGAVKIGTTVYLTFNEAVQAAKSGDTIEVVANCEGSQEASFDGLAISINEGVTFTADIAKISKNLVIAGAGNLATKGAANIEVAATLDLSGLTYQQSAGCGKFDIDSTGIVKYPYNIASPAWAPVVQTAINSAADGAQVYTDMDNGTGGNQYTYGNGVWAAGDTIATVKIDNIGYGTLLDAMLASMNDAKATITVLADHTTYGWDGAKASKTCADLTIDLNSKKVSVAPTNGAYKANIRFFQGTTAKIMNGTLARAGRGIDIIRSYATKVTLENVTIDATDVDGQAIIWTNGDLDLDGTTAIINVPAGVKAIDCGNYAGSDYAMGTLTFNTTGELAGDWLFAGGTNAVKQTPNFAADAKFYYGSKRYTAFAAADVAALGFAARVGDEPAPTGEDVESTDGQLYKTLVAALAAAKDADTVTLVSDITTDAVAAFAITNNITIDFADKTITKTVPNDYVFDIKSGATVVFNGTTGGVSFYPITQGLNRNNPASLIRNKGSLTINGGVYATDFCIVKNDEDPTAGVFVANGGTFTVTAVAPEAGDQFEGQWALMNWATATINGGVWTGVIGTRASDANSVSVAGTTEITALGAGSAATYVLRVGGRDSATTLTKGFPRVKKAGLGLDDVALEFNTSITDADQYLKVASGDYITVRRAIAITGVTLDVAAATVKVGATTNLVATVTPSDADVTNTVWTSDNEAAATVTNGTVYAIAAGSANITVTKYAAGGTSGSATCAVTVESAGQQIAPGGSPVDVVAESAEAATNGVTVTVSSPDETIVSDAEYKDYFYVKATDLGGGTYRLTAELKPEITQAADETEQIADGLSDIAAGEASSIQIENAKPGLWYSVKFTDNVSLIGTAAEGDRAQAQADGSVTVRMPKSGDEPTQQFYQVQVNTTDKGTVQ